MYCTILVLQSFVTGKPRRVMANGMEIQMNEMCESQVYAKSDIECFMCLPFYANDPCTDDGLFYRLIDEMFIICRLLSEMANYCAGFLIRRTTVQLLSVWCTAATK